MIFLHLDSSPSCFFFENGRVHTFMSFSFSSFTALGNLFFSFFSWQMDALLERGVFFSGCEYRTTVGFLFEYKGNGNGMAWHTKNCMDGFEIMCQRGKRRFSASNWRMKRKRGRRGVKRSARERKHFLKQRIMPFLISIHFCNTRLHLCLNIEL